MKNFDYVQPRSESEVLELLSPEPGVTSLLAGGTDLVGLMKKMIVTPDRVVDIGDLPELRTIEMDATEQLWIGAGVRLDELLSSSTTDPYPAVKQAIQGISSIQLQAQGTVGGEILRRPLCWYFRDGHGLLADNGKRIIHGDNRYHAILGNHGPAKFVSASRLAPALVSLGAKVRVVGPDPDQESILPLESLYRTPRDESQREHTLLPNQLLTHVILASDQGDLSAAYEVRHGEGPDAPLAAAAATLQVVAGVIQKARIVLGQVAPIPWISGEAERVCLGHPPDEDTASQAGEAAVAEAMPLSENGYKIQLAKVSVRRAILRAAGSFI